MAFNSDSKTFWDNFAVSKSTLVSRFEHEMYDDVIADIADTIRPHFPFMRYKMLDLVQMFQNIKNYKAEFYRKPYKIAGRQFGEYDSRNPYSIFNSSPIIIKNYRGDYLQYNKIMEYFIEPLRLRARRLNQLESVLTWYKNHTKTIVEHCIKVGCIIDAEKIREAVYRLHYECTEFRITHLCALIDLWKPQRILDFSAGRGARLMAALSRDSQIEFYCGVDPDPTVHVAYNEILSWAMTVEQINPKKYKMIEGAFEEIPDTDLLPNYDLVFTSPPYFDTEIYDDDPNRNTKQSIVKFPTLDTWINGFLEPSIQKAWRLLTRGGRLAIAINDSSDAKYLDRFLDICHNLPSRGPYEVISYSGFENNIPTSPQPIWIFMKL